MFLPTPKRELNVRSVEDIERVVKKVEEMKLAGVLGDLEVSVKVMDDTWVLLCHKIGPTESDNGCGGGSVGVYCSWNTGTEVDDVFRSSDMSYKSSSGNSTVSVMTWIILLSLVVLLVLLVVVTCLWSGGYGTIRMHLYYHSSD